MEYLAGIKLFTVGMGVILASAQALKIAATKKKGDPMATAQLLSDKELKGLTGQGIKLSETLTLKQKYVNEGICIFGPTGSGKTSNFFMPNLLSEGIEGSIIALDPKGELYETTSHFQRTVCKRKVIRFAPLDPKLSSRYNLLENCKDTSEVLMLASTLLYNGSLSLEIATGRKGGSTEWITMAEPLLAAALLYVRGLGNPFNTIESALEMIISLETTDLYYLFKYCENEDAKRQFDTFKTTIEAQNTVSGIKITLASNIKLFTDNKINEVGSYSDFNFEDLRKEKTVIYRTYPEHKALYISPFMASFFTQMLNKLIENHKKAPLPITIFFDEFANIGMVSNMQGYASTVRSREISLNVCLQSITQLEQIYGKESANSIINNLKTKIFLPGLSDMTTLNYASDLSGRAEIDTVSFNEDKANNRTYSHAKSTRNTLNPDEIRRLSSDKLLIITSNRQCVLSNQNPYYKKEEYTSKVKKMPNQILRTGYYDTGIKKELIKLLEETANLNYAISQAKKEKDKELENLIAKENRPTKNKKKSLADEIFGD